MFLKSKSDHTKSGPSLSVGFPLPGPHSHPSLSILWRPTDTMFSFPYYLVLKTEVGEEFQTTVHIEL